MTLTERYLTAAYMQRRFYQNETIPGEATLDEGTAQFLIDETYYVVAGVIGSGVADVNNTAVNICGNMMQRWKDGKDDPFELTEKELHRLQDTFNAIPLGIHDPNDYELNENG